MIVQLSVKNLIISITNIQKHLDAKGKDRLSDASRKKSLSMLRDMQMALRDRIYRLETRLDPEEWEAEAGAKVRVRQSPDLVGRIGTVFAFIPRPEGLVPVEYVDHPSQWYAPKDIQLVVESKIFQQYY